MPSLEIVEIEDDAVPAAVETGDVQLTESKPSANAPLSNEKRKRSTQKAEPNTSNKTKPAKKQKKQQLKLGQFFAAKKSAPKEEGPGPSTASAVLDTLNAKRKSELIDIVVGKPSSRRSETKATRRLFMTKSPLETATEATTEVAVPIAEKTNATSQSNDTIAPDGTNEVPDQLPSSVITPKSNVSPCPTAPVPTTDCAENPTPPPRVATEQIIKDHQETWVTPNERKDAPVSKIQEDVATKANGVEDSIITSTGKRAATTATNPTEDSMKRCEESIETNAVNDDMIISTAKSTASNETIPAEDSVAISAENQDESKDRNTDKSITLIEKSKSSSVAKKQEPKEGSAKRSSKKALSEVTLLARQTRLEELLSLCRNGLEEESWTFPIPSFPEGCADLDVCIATISTLVEGSPEDLSSLTERVQLHLGEDSFPLEDIKSKIQEIATRNNYLTIVQDSSDPDLMWRWEAVTQSLIPSSGTVSKVRGVRKKLAAVIEALRNTSTSESRLNQLEKQLQAARLAARSHWANVCAKIAEKERKAREVAVAKEKKKQDAAAAKQKKQQEATLKKQQAEAAKLMKKEKKEEESRKKQNQRKAKENVLQNQRKCLMSFVRKKSTTEAKIDTKSTAAPGQWDADTFRSSLLDDNASPNPRPFGTLSKKALASRRRRSKIIQVPVTVTVIQDGQVDNPFAREESYAEEQLVTIKNRFSFLKFHEDVRPPYYGTWSKRSAVVSGRKPIAKDTEFLNYDVDSELEWEEGDDEIGEELDDNPADDDEDEDEPTAEEDDGWLAADDDEDHGDRKALQLCYVLGPKNGRALTASGYSEHEGRILLNQLKAVVLCKDKICLDVAPSVAPTNATEESDEPELSDHNMKTFAKFVHNCKLGSREKVVEEMLKEHKSVVSTRAQAYRVLDAVASKHKHAVMGVVWQVKSEVLESVGLQDLKDNDEEEVMQRVATFIHNRRTASKEKLAEELCESLSIRSKAEGLRLIALIAEKKKHHLSGVYWQVKREIQEKFGLILPEIGPENAPKDGTATPPPTRDNLSVPVASVPVLPHGGKDESLQKPSSATGTKKTLDSFLKAPK